MYMYLIFLEYEEKAYNSPFLKAGYRMIVDKTCPQLN